MRTILRGFWILTGIGVVSSVVGCSAPCSETHSCGTYVPPSGGAAGSSAGGETHGGAVGDAGAANGGSVGGSGTAGAGAVAGASGDAGDAGRGGATCDTTRDPSVESCLVDDEYAVFVAPSGDDDEAGSKAAPVATLSKAIQLAAGAKFVIVCDAKYDEHVTVARGAQIYGGFKCSDWSAETGAPLFKPTTPGPALSIDSVAEHVLLTHVDFEVGDAMSNGETALTAIVTASPMVTFESVSLKAGKGKAGAIGTLAAFTFPNAGTLNGNAETSAGVGGASKTCLCQASLSSAGGLGGAPAIGGQSGTKGFPDLGGGLGGDPGKSCSSGGGGADGSDGPAAAPGSGASTLGATTPAGWQPAHGKDGEAGSPGQGGGGGASHNALGHGGGGGCGGCGGNGAKAGKGGGGSIALLLVNSPVVLHSSTLTTSDAGDGGAGLAGQPGQADVGSSGNSLASANSCGGGTGGKGGAGGASGGGAGGISVAIVWKGPTPPSLTDTTSTTGKAGAAGIGGVPGTNDGVAGLKQDLLQVP
jgi:hypothetical protein